MAIGGRELPNTASLSLPPLWTMVRRTPGLPPGTRPPKSHTHRLATGVVLVTYQRGHTDIVAGREKLPLICIFGYGSAVFSIVQLL